MTPPTRMQLARRRLRVARYSISAVALSAFTAFGFAVRDAHPATHPATTTPTVVTTSDDDSSTDDYSGSVVISPAPQAVAPTIQSGGS